MIQESTWNFFLFKPILDEKKIFVLDFGLMWDFELNEADLGINWWSIFKVISKEFFFKNIFF